MFRKISRDFVPSGGFDLPPVQQVVVNNRVSFVRKPVNRLPVENFDLENLVKAGVPLKEVNSKLLSPDDETVLDALDSVLPVDGDSDDVPVVDPGSENV